MYGVLFPFDADLDSVLQILHLRVYRLKGRESWSQVSGQRQPGAGNDTEMFWSGNIMEMYDLTSIRPAFIYLAYLQK